MEKGYIVNWEGEKAIWERLFQPSKKDSEGVPVGPENEGWGLDVKPEECNLVLTEAPNAPVQLQRNADEMVFEEFGFRGYDRTIGLYGRTVRSRLLRQADDMAAPALNAYAPSPFPDTAASPAGLPLECLLVVDAGHSHTTVTPLYHGRPLQQAIRRLEVGGKTLTNQLKELISRTFDVRKEDHIVSEMKEEVCYVSQTFDADLEKTWRGGRYDRREVDSSIVVDYVLPDYETIKRGFARPHDPRLNLRNSALGLGTEGGRREHVLTLGNERFVVPELLFTPSDIGMQQAGLPHALLQSIDSLPAGLHQAFLANILVTGGTSLLPGFLERLEASVRQLVDEDTLVRVARAKDPVKNAWMGGARMAQSPEMLGSVMVTRQEWMEHGEGWVRRKFAGKVGR